MVGWVNGKERRGAGRKGGSFGPLSAFAEEVTVNSRCCSQQLLANSFLHWLFI